MTAENLLIIRHSGLRHVDEASVLDVLNGAALRLPRREIHVEAGEFGADVDEGVWDRSERYHARKAAEVREAAEEQGSTRIMYFGMAEIPHVIALGAFVGDERRVDVFDYDRDRGSWAWPASEPTLEVEVEGAPAERLTQGGIAVVRVEMSASISDADVEAVLGSQMLAHVRIRPKGIVPAVGIVRSAEDAQQVREALRAVLSAISDARPGVEVIHLFVAAPNSVCFLIGQELHLRSGPPVQTYRFRRHSDGPNYREAIPLTSADVESTDVELTDDQVARARQIREQVWPASLQDVLQYAAMMRDRAGEDGSRPWYHAHAQRELLSEVRPYPPLPPLWEVADQDDAVDPEPYPGVEYGHDKSRHLWRLSDPLLCGLSEAVDGNDEELKRLIRLFLFHEYLHDYHALTKYNAAEVGRFPNCLERIDYTADLYALLHELDHASVYERHRVRDEKDQKAFLVDVLDLMIRSMWAFEPLGDLERWQVRRIRRYLNWYWRQVQVQRAPALRTALHILARQPAIELAGCRIGTEGRREYVFLTKPDPTTDLSIGLVTEDERLLRITNSVNSNIEELLAAFRTRDHRSIKVFFQGVYEDAAQFGGTLPKT